MNGIHETHSDRFSRLVAHRSEHLQYAHLLDDGRSGA